MTPREYVLRIRGAERAIKRQWKQRANEVISTAGGIRAKRLDGRRIFRALIGKDDDWEELGDVDKSILEESRARAREAREKKAS